VLDSLCNLFFVLFEELKGLRPRFLLELAELITPPVARYPHFPFFVVEVRVLPGQAHHGQYPDFEVFIPLFVFLR
jgi:hypothetical protein